ncbi:hypothetical protein [Bordetella petrii]|uniref:hypothetical protein n=1 Tax=Bordetella petrii TaxID=94624 RepID=UPI00048EAD6B|nr:hypothetical protein [Bordetella petrii]
MTPLRSTLRPILASMACALLAACADSPPRQADMDYRSRPPSTTSASSGASDPSGQRLIIKSGEGERLNLPWFIRDAQHWINTN